MKFTKILALLLVLVLLVSAFASCNESEEETKDKTGETNVETDPEKNNGTEVTPGSDTESESVTEKIIEIPVEEKDYGDELFLQVYMKTYFDLLWTKDGGSNVVSAALYNRQEMIMDRIGVEIVGSETEGGSSNYEQAFVTSIKNKDGAVDLLVSNPYVKIPAMVTGGYLRNYRTMDNINLDADYWDIELMEQLSAYDKLYLGYSRFNIPKTVSIAYNKDLMEQYGDSLDETVYEMVDNYHWTIDRMISLANLVYIDNTGDGKSVDDTFGITGVQWLAFVSFLQASDIQLVEMDETGAYKVSVYNEKNKERTTTLVDKLKALAKSDCAWFRFRAESTPLVPLTTGRTLMGITNTITLDDFLKFDINFGVLPYPMYDEAQKDVGYKTLNSDGFTLLPAYMRNEEMTGDTLELLSYYGDAVHSAVFEKLLGKQVADSPDDARMLNIIWAGICSDFGMVFSHGESSLDTNLYMLPTLTNANGTEQIASYVARYESVANRALARLMKQMEKLK